MPSIKKTQDFADQLLIDIDNDVGNIHDDEPDIISSDFNKSLANALASFRSSSFDADGFVKRMTEMSLDNKKDNEMIRNILNNLQTDYANVETLNQSEILLRRDIENVCQQMPEMTDSVNLMRDSIIESNVATGDVSRSLVFENVDNSDNLESQVNDIEKRHNLLRHIKNTIVPNTLKAGEIAVQVVPYSKLFAEIDVIHNRKASMIGSIKNLNTTMHESAMSESDIISETHSLYNEANLEYVMESVAPISKVDVNDTITIEQNKSNVIKKEDLQIKETVSTLLKNINICNTSSIMMAEMGVDGFEEFVKDEYKKSHKSDKNVDAFLEAMGGFMGSNSDSPFNHITADDLNQVDYKEIKGCYVKYIDPLRMIPIRLGKRIIGYYYVTTTMDLQVNSANPNGIVDLSFQTYMRDKNLVDTLANVIIRSFDKQMLSKNIKLKNEIADIIMAHKFSEGRLSFIYIPDDEVVRISVNEDAEGRGHSMIEPAMFPARMYLMLTLYNMLYILNNTTTRVHYLKSSGLNKNYAANIQRTMRKYQSRRITIDDIYSYNGVLNKIGGMGEMILPAGKNDYKAIETDTIPAATTPIELDFLEMLRKQALAATGNPSIAVANAIDEVDFATTLKLSNTRTLSTVSSYKIDFNAGITELYRRIIKYETDMEDTDIQAFSFKFNSIKQQDLDITVDMINNFNQMVDLVASIYFTKSEIEDENGVPTAKMMHLRRLLAKEYLPQLNFDKLDDTIDKVNLDAVDDELQAIVTNNKIEGEEVTNN